MIHFALKKTLKIGGNKTTRRLNRVFVCCHRPKFVCFDDAQRSADQRDLSGEQCSVFMTAACDFGFCRTFNCRDKKKRKVCRKTDSRLCPFPFSKGEVASVVFLFSWPVGYFVVTIESICFHKSVSVSHFLSVSNALLVAGLLKCKNRTYNLFSPSLLMRRNIQRKHHSSSISCFRADETSTECSAWSLEYSFIV